MNKRISFLIFNFLGLEVTWAACAYGAIHNFPLLGAIVGCVYIMIHMILTPNRMLDLLTLTSLTAIGVALDYINMKIGIISFRSIDSNFIPLWLVILWSVFSLMIPHSLLWLSRRPVIASLLGGISGSFSYWLGHKLGAISLGENFISNSIIYFVEWAIFIPIAFVIFRAISQSKLITKIA